MSKTAFNSNSNVNPFTVAKEFLTPDKVQGMINSDKLDTRISISAKSTNGKVESHVYAYSSLIKEESETSCKVNINSKGIEIDANGKNIKIPMKLIWGLLTIVTSILDVCEKITDLMTAFGIRFKSLVEKFTHEFKSSVTIDDKTLLDVMSESKVCRHPDEFRRVTISRHGITYKFIMDADSDLRGILLSVLAENGAEYGWYTVRVDNNKPFRFKYSSK